RHLTHQHAPVAALLLQPQPPPAIHPLSLHDALPIWSRLNESVGLQHAPHDSDGAIGQSFGDLERVGVTVDVVERHEPRLAAALRDRKSTRLNSSHVKISYAVSCLKKKENSVFTNPCS